MTPDIEESKAKEDRSAGGFYKCRFSLLESLAEATSHLLSKSGRTSTNYGGFLAIEFGDGYDALFVPLVTSAEESGPASAAMIEEEFHRMDSRRRTVLAGLRRHIAASNTSLRENADGRWDLQFDGGTSEMWVGPFLTRLTERHDAADALVCLINTALLPHIDRGVAETLIAAEEPYRPKPWKNDDEIEPAFGPGVLSLDCDGLADDNDPPKDAEGFLNAIAPTRHSPTQLVINKLAERVGRKRFAADLCKGGCQLEYSDKLDHYYANPRSKKLARAIEKDGLDATVDRLAKRFADVDSARGNAIRIIKTVMAKAGFVLDRDGDTYWFGTTHRMAAFKVGRALTVEVIGKKPETVVRSWLVKAAILPVVPTPDQLAAFSASDELPIRESHLPKKKPSEQDPLPALDGLNVVALDRKADALIRETQEFVAAKPGKNRIGELHEVLSLWLKPFWYRAGDPWASDEWWLQMAAAVWKARRWDEAAAILILHGQTPSDFEIEDRLGIYDRWCDELFADEILWLFADRLPWPVDEGKFPEFPDKFKPKPAHWARRAARALREHLDALRRDASDENSCHLGYALIECAKLDSNSCKVWMQAGEMELLERRLKLWALEGNLLYADLGPACEVAAELGWTWLPEALASNRSFIPAQFNDEERYSAPGEVALKLSWVKPSSLAARFAAYALADISPEIFRARAESMAGGPKFYETGRLIVRNWLTADKFAASIAWQRCRAAGVV